MPTKPPLGASIREVAFSSPDAEIVVSFPIELDLAQAIARLIEHAHSINLDIYTGPGDPRLHALLREIGFLHDKKQEDYGTDEDPFANVRQSEQWGVPAWVGAMVRLNDKVKRLQAFAQKGSLANESAEDSMMDIAVYALIALILYREASDAD